mmetsp:Transcript_8931/g.13069  ORF Transcript_8931/g.13069 Transcript_8931/m.13069 type:complete len:102 (-) Transcript_8931:734-1039(-)
MEVISTHVTTFFMQDLSDRGLLTPVQVPGPLTPPKLRPMPLARASTTRMCEPNVHGVQAPTTIGNMIPPTGLAKTCVVVLAAVFNVTARLDNPSIQPALFL